MATNPAKRGIIRAHNGCLATIELFRDTLDKAYFQEIGRYEENRLGYRCD